MAGRLKELSDASTAEEQRRAALPKSASDYKVTLPTDFKLPEGVQIDLENPAWPAFAEFAHKRGLSQDDFAQGAKLITEMQLASQAKHQQAINDYRTAEEAKLGDNSKARVEAVNRFIDANATPEAAKDIKASLTNAAITQFLEKTISVLSSNGITAFNGSGRQDGPKPGEIQGYDKMSWTEKFRNRTRSEQQQRQN